jgi:hypothetical protein
MASELQKGEVGRDGDYRGDRIGQRHGSVECWTCAAVMVVEMERSLSGSPPAICAGCDPDLATRIADVLGKVGVGCSIAPKLDDVIKNEVFRGTDLLILGATSEGHAALAEVARHVANYAPSLRVVAIVPEQHRECVPSSERVVALSYPVGLGSFVEFFERLQSIGREVAAPDGDL